MLLSVAGSEIRAGERDAEGLLTRVLSVTDEQDLLARPGRWQRNDLRVRSIGRALVASVAGVPREIGGLDPAAWVLQREVGGRKAWRDTKTGNLGR